MSGRRDYQPVASENQEDTNASSSSSSEQHVVGYQVMPLVGGADATTTSAPDTCSVVIHDASSDSESDDDQLHARQPGHGRDMTPRYDRLAPRDKDHPLANYDKDDDDDYDDDPIVDPANQHLRDAVRQEPPAPYVPPARVVGMQPNDGVFSNILAKCDFKPEEQSKPADEPPPYEEVAQDRAPPYFDTTVIATSDDPDEMLVEGLPAGGVFSFFWSMLISMSFQFIGFLLTYLLHTSHAGKNGSRAGLGVTFIQYGLYMRSKEFHQEEIEFYERTHSPEEVQAEVEAHASRNLWLSYFLMILGWFIIIRSIGEYIRIRRMLAAYLYSPENRV
jgi:hypothetical protein